MSDHSPGPWRWEDDGFLVSAAEPDGHILCTQEDYDCTEEDSRLIAAAPELLEALKLEHSADDGEDCWRASQGVPTANCSTCKLIARVETGP